MGSVMGTSLANLVSMSEGEAEGEADHTAVHGAPFISKLYKIITTASSSDCITWGAAGDTILVRDPPKFAREVLPQYFKHDNIRSFIRQLNIYGFQRCRTPQSSDGELEFYHNKFMFGRTDLVAGIIRGIPSQVGRRRVPPPRPSPLAFLPRPPRAPRPSASPSARPRRPPPAHTSLRRGVGSARTSGRRSAARRSRST